MKRVFALLFALVLVTGLSFAQSTPAQTDDANASSHAGKSKSKFKKAGSATADAAKATGSAIKEGAEATGNKTKSVAKKSKDKVSGDSDKTAAGDKLDINTATKDQLVALPGIGDVYAQKIIDGRPYTSKRELLTKNIIPQSAYDKCKEQIIAHRATAGTTKAKSKAATK
jgi:DNA uptake protein ComE-like DNA-binding protein